MVTSRGNANQLQADLETYHRKISDQRDAITSGRPVPQIKENRKLPHILGCLHSLRDYQLPGLRNSGYRYSRDIVFNAARTNPWVPRGVWDEVYDIGKRIDELQKSVVKHSGALTDTEQQLYNELGRRISACIHEISTLDEGEEIMTDAPSSPTALEKQKHCHTQ